MIALVFSCEEERRANGEGVADEARDSPIATANVGDGDSVFTEDRRRFQPLTTRAMPETCAGQRRLTGRVGEYVRQREEEEMTGQARIRRLQDTITIAGTAVIAFSVWSLAKTWLFLSLAGESALRWLLGLLGIGNDALTIAVYASLAAIVIIDLGVRIYVGLSARAEGHGKRKSPLYLVIAVIIALLNISSLCAIALGAPSGVPPLSMMVSVIIEATAIAALALVVYGGIRLRQMRKMAE